MSFRLNSKIAEAVKNYDLTDNVVISAVTFSSEFENNMDRFIKRKNRNRKIMLVAKSSILSVFVIALISTWVFVMLLPRNEGNIDPLSPSHHEGSNPNTESPDIENPNMENPDMDNPNYIPALQDPQSEIAYSRFVNFEFPIDIISSGDSIYIARMFVSVDVTYTIDINAERGSTVFSGLRESPDEEGTNGRWFSYSSHSQMPYSNTIPILGIAPGYYYLFIGNHGLEDVTGITVKMTANNPYDERSDFELSEFFLPFFQDLIDAQNP